MTLTEPTKGTNPNCRIGKITFKRGKSSRILTEFNVTTNRLLAARRSEKGA